MTWTSTSWSTGRSTVASELVVLLGRDVAARLIRLNQGGLRLVYDAGYVGSRGATPLSLSMPLEIAEHADRVVSAWLWNLLPDSEAVLARWSRTFHVSSRSPFSLLATPVGMDCAGAVRFVTADHLDAALSGEGTVTWLTEADVAQRLRDLRTDATARLGASSTGQFSLAGAQAKTALLYQDGRWGVPSGITPRCCGSRASERSWSSDTTASPAVVVSGGCIRRTCVRRSASRRPASTKPRVAPRALRSPVCCAGRCPRRRPRRRSSGFLMR